MHVHRRRLRPGGGSRLCGDVDWEATGARVKRLMRVIAEAAIPLEALYRSEMDGTALCGPVKAAIASAVQEIREVMADA